MELRDRRGVVAHGSHWGELSIKIRRARWTMRCGSLPCSLCMAQRTAYYGMTRPSDGLPVETLIVIRLTAASRPREKLWPAVSSAVPQLQNSA